MSFATATLTILLSIMAFYVFLAVYIVIHLLSRYFFKSRQEQGIPQ